jgi:hypothetical protein
MRGQICKPIDRLRRVTAIEAGLFQEQARKLGRDAGEEHHEQDHCDSGHGLSESSSGPEDQFDGLTRAFVRLTNLSSYPLDRLNRYEASLWRQACQVLFTLRCLDRRKPWEAWAQSKRR